MLLQFTVNFSTLPGQNLFICGNIELLGSNKDYSALPMFYLDSQHWRIEFEIQEKQIEVLEYYFVLKDDNKNLLRREWRTRKLEIKKLKQYKHLHITDIWSSVDSPVNCFETSFFENIYTKPFSKEPPFIKCTHKFKVKAPLLQKDESIVMVGDIPALGNWKTSEGILLDHINKDNFEASLNLADFDGYFQYKYVVIDKNTKSFKKFEIGENRFFNGLTIDNQLTIKDDEFFHYDVSDYWRGTGVAVPVFSLRSNDSLGVGEFLDLKLMADWVKKVNIKIIQILPINDTTANNDKFDTYPYAGITVFGLHPQYIKISEIPYKISKKTKDELEKNCKHFNSFPTIQYEEVMALKWKYLKQIFEENQNEIENDTEFNNFIEKNKNWLLPYATFCINRDKYGTPDFTKWENHKEFEIKEIEEYASGNPLFNLQYFVQYQLHLQLLDAVKYLRSQGISLKGDIPIGIYRHSCDAWVYPELFNLEMQAGAPPDSFAIKGQNWGFPTYNWEKMKEDGFRWWKDRFTHMSNYFDAYRIDHILGFFRIWQIPMDAVQGILGYFEPAIPIYKHEFWQREINFEYFRYCKPFITDDILWRFFGDDMHWMKGVFFDYYFDRFHFKHEFNTQRKLSDHFKLNEYEDKIKNGLLDLLTNFLMIEAENSNQNEFHPRINFFETLSYQYLDDETKRKLADLYNDYFYKRQNDFWEQKGMEKLPAIRRATNMLICGEDLGMVPECVPKVMKELSILSLEVQRMPKDPKTMFFHPDDAPYLSVVSPSSHDTSTLRGWWEEDADVRQRFYNNILGNWGEAPSIMTSDILKQIFIQHLYSKAMLVIFPLQDYLGLDDELKNPDVDSERINIPAKIPHFWNYRMHLNLENLVSQDEFNNRIKVMIINSGR